MRTLLLDTSGSATTAVLAEDGHLLGASVLRAQPLVHQQEQIRVLMQQTGVTLQEVDRVAVVVGPGSWTGLNIGVTAAKTLAQVLGVPLVELTSLDALAASQAWHGGRVCSLIDAKRGNVYRAFYGKPPENATPASEVQVVPFTQLRDELRGEEGVPLVVECGGVYGKRLREELPESVYRNVDELPLNGLLAALAGGAVRTGDEILGVMPVYGQKLVR